MAARYWVGGTAAWDGTAGSKWALFSGGAGGQPVPTSSDDVYFTNLSTGTCTISAGNTGALTINCTGHTGTIAGTAPISVANSVTLVAGQTFTYTGTLTLTGTGTLTTGGKTIGPLTVNSPGGTVTLGSALTLSSACDLNITAGTLNTSGSSYSVSASNISVSAGATFRLQGSTITLVSSTFTADPSSSIDVGTSTITSTFQNPVFNGGGKTYNNVSFTSTTGGGTVTINGANSFSNLTATAPNSGVTTYLFSANQTITTLTCSGASAVRRIALKSSTRSAITLNAATWTTVTDVDFYRITLTNAKSPTRGGNLGGNTNITFPAAKTVYWNLAGAQSWSATGWATSSGGTPALNNFPLAQDTAVFDNTGSVTGTITADGGFAVGTVDMSTRTTAMTLSITDIDVLANWTNGSGTTLAGTGALNFAAISGTQTITSAGKSFAANITGIETVISLADALTTSGFVQARGGLTLNNNTLTCDNFYSLGAITRTIAFGTGNITVTGTGVNAVNISSSSFSVTGTPVINMTYSGASPATIANVGLSEANSISYNVTAGSYALTFSSTSNVRNLNFTGFAGSLAATTFSIYGNLILSSGMTVSSSSNIFLASTSGTKTITSNGATLGFVYISGSGGTFQLQDSLNTGFRPLQLINGTLDLNGQTATVNNLETGAGTKNLTFNGGTVNVLTNGTTAFNNAAPTGFTTTAGTGTGTIRMSGSSAKTFVGGGSTYNCTLDQGGAGALTITGANTFSNITNTYGSTGATSILFTAGTTTTFANWNASGQSGRLLTIGSVTAASHTLSKASGIVGANFLSVSRSTATGGATWYAGANSTNGGNNSGWLFSNAPSVSGNFLAFFM